MEEAPLKKEKEKATTITPAAKVAKERKELTPEERKAIESECQRMRASARWLRVLGFVILLLVGGLFWFGAVVFYKAGELTVLDSKKEDITEEVRKEIKFEFSQPRNKKTLGKFVTVYKTRRIFERPNIVVAIASGDYPQLQRLHNKIFAQLQLEPVPPLDSQFNEQMAPYVTESGDVNVTLWVKEHPMAQPPNNEAIQIQTKQIESRVAMIEGFEKETDKAFQSIKNILENE